jgi:hypothetical protein
LRRDPSIAGIIKLIEAMEHDGEQRGMGRVACFAEYTRAVLHNGLGNYAAATAACSSLEYRDLGVHGWTLAELVEAATRAGDPAPAEQAREGLKGGGASGTPWAPGAQALAEAQVGRPCSSVHVRSSGTYAKSSPSSTSPHGTSLPWSCPYTQGHKPRRRRCDLR